MLFDKSSFDNLKNIKDNVLAVFLVNYAIGYISFSIYSYQNSLGVINAFDLQYLLAGLIPSSTIAVLFVVLSKMELVYDFIKTTLTYSERKALRFIKLILAILTTLIFIYGAFAFLFILIFSFIDQLAVVKNEILTTMYIPFLTLIIAPLIVPENIVFKNKIFHLLYRISITKTSSEFGLSKFILIIFISLSVVYYYTNLYKHIPQELGGVKPKKAILYSDADIFNKPAKASALYSDTVLVYYYNSSSFIYKKSPAEIKSTEVNRTKISKVVWLD